MWEAFANFRGLDSRVITKRWVLQTPGADGAAFTLALNSMEALRDALSQISNAVLQDSGVRYLVPMYAVGAGDLTEQALINVWAEDPDNAIDELALTQVYIPAPVVGIFMGTSGADYNIVDRTDAALQAYIDVLSSEAYISDMEVLDTGTAVNGMQNGRRVTRKLPRP